MAHGPAQFHFVVPAVVDRDGDVESARDRAQERLELYLADAQSIGAEVSGEVGPADVVEAIAAAARTQQYDAIILFTEPAGLSAWLKHDLVSRVKRRVSLPVEAVPITPGEADLAQGKGSTEAATAAGPGPVVPTGEHVEAIRSTFGHFEGGLTDYVEGQGFGGGDTPQQPRGDNRT